MSLSIKQIEQRIEEIDSLADPLSKRYGRLLNWQNSSDPFWHYGIGLSDTDIFDTGCGLSLFTRKEAKFVIGIDGIVFTPEQTIERLKHALQVFANWEYTVPGWNCEHLGRLIATDKPRCYQSQPIWWLCDLTSEGDHKTAYKVFQDYLEKANSKLKQ